VYVVVTVILAGCYISLKNKPMEKQSIGEPREGSGRFGEKINLSALAGLDIRIVQP